MGRAARPTALVLLFLLGISALIGAAGLISDPTGQAVQMPPGMLDKTPFDSYLIPGIILGTFNGILSLIIAMLVIRRHRLRGWLIVFQGGVLIVWLTAEVLMDLYFAALTLPYYAIGILLVITGTIVITRQRK